MTTSTTSSGTTHDDDVDGERGRLMTSLIEEASATQKSNDYAKAADMWEAIVDHKFRRMPAAVFVRLVAAYGKSGQFGKAEQVRHRARERDALTPELFSEMVKVFRDAGQLSRARNIVAKAIDGMPGAGDKREMLLMLAEMDAELANVPRALRVLNEVVRSYDEPPSDSHTRAVAGLVARRLDQMAIADDWENYWRQRKDFVYLHVVRRLIETIAASASAVADIGSNKSPLLDFYGKVEHKFSVDIDAPYVADDVVSVTQDFYIWEPPVNLQVGTCLQVMEHVPDPERFAKRLLELFEVLIVSVPYKEPAGLNPGHINNDLTLETMVNWFGREPNYYYIAKELSDNERIICVFDTKTNAKFPALNAESRTAAQFAHRWSYDALSLEDA